MSQFLVLLVAVLAVDAAMASASRLQYGYYSQTCPQAEKIVRDVIGRNMMREPRSAASVMRLQFHDCFVNVRNYPTVSFLVQWRTHTHNTHTVSQLSFGFDFRAATLHCCWMTPPTCWVRSWRFPTSTPSDHTK